MCKMYTDRISLDSTPGNPLDADSLAGAFFGDFPATLAQTHDVVDPWAGRAKPPYLDPKARGADLTMVDSWLDRVEASLAHDGVEQAFPRVHVRDEALDHDDPILVRVDGTLRHRLPYGIGEVDADNIRELGPGKAQQLATQTRDNVVQRVGRLMSARYPGSHIVVS